MHGLLTAPQLSLSSITLRLFVSLLIAGAILKLGTDNRGRNRDSLAEYRARGAGGRDRFCYVVQMPRAFRYRLLYEQPETLKEVCKIVIGERSV